MLELLLPDVRREFARLKKCSPYWYELVTGDTGFRADAKQLEKTIDDDFSLQFFIDVDIFPLKLIQRLRVLQTLLLWLVIALFPNGVSANFLYSLLTKIYIQLVSTEECKELQHWDIGDDPTDLESWKKFFSVEHQLGWVEISTNKQLEDCLRVTDKGMRHIQKLKSIMDHPFSPLGSWNVLLGAEQDVLCDAATH